MAKSNHRITLVLAAICAITFFIRVTFPYQTVFGSGFVNFLETDAYNRMWYAKMIAAMPVWDAIQFTVSNNLLFSGLVALLSQAAALESVGAWLPPLLAVLTVLVVYAIGRAIWRPAVGLTAAMLVAIIPSEFLHRSLLGFADHHAMETLLLVLVIFLAIKAVKANRYLTRYSILCGTSLFLYMANWPSGIYFIGGMLGCFVAGIVGQNVMARRPWWEAIPGLVVAGVIGLALYLPWGGWRQLLWFVPQEAGPAAVPIARAGETVGTLLTPVSRRTISELMPLLAPYGKFSLAVVITNLHLFTITAVLGAVFAWRYRTDRAVLMLLIWTAIMLAITLNHRRFMYYLTVNVGLISAFALYELAKYLKGHAHFNVAFMALPLVLVSMPMIQAAGINQPVKMSTEWHDALVWLKRQPDSGMVSAWSDYGHWIQYVAEKEPNYMPGPGGVLIARFLLAEDWDTGQELLEDMETGYLIVDRVTLTQKYYALNVYAALGERDKMKTLGVRLFNGEPPPAFLQPIYRSGNIRIFRTASGYPPG